MSRVSSYSVIKIFFARYPIKSDQAIIPPPTSHSFCLHSVKNFDIYWLTWISWNKAHHSVLGIFSIYTANRWKDKSVQPMSSFARFVSTPSCSLSPLKSLQIKCTLFWSLSPTLWHGYTKVGTWEAKGNRMGVLMWALYCEYCSRERFSQD